MSAQWLDAFRIALIQEQYERCAELSADMPSFKNKREIEEAIALVKEALKRSKDEQRNIQDTMQKIKKNINFLAYNEVHKLSTLS